MRGSRPRLRPYARHSGPPARGGEHHRTAAGAATPNTAGRPRRPALRTQQAWCACNLASAIRHVSLCPREAPRPAAAMCMRFGAPSDCCRDALLTREAPAWQPDAVRGSGDATAAATLIFLAFLKRPTSWMIFGFLGDTEKSIGQQENERRHNSVPWKN